MGRGQVDPMSLSLAPLRNQRVNFASIPFGPLRERCPQKTARLSSPLASLFKGPVLSCIFLLLHRYWQRAGFRLYPSAMQVPGCRGVSRPRRKTCQNLRSETHGLHTRPLLLLLLLLLLPKSTGRLLSPSHALLPKHTIQIHHTISRTHCLLERWTCMRRLSQNSLTRTNIKFQEGKINK